jgi:hypothetical protein
MWCCRIIEETADCADAGYIKWGIFLFQGKPYSRNRRGKQSPTAFLPLAPKKCHEVSPLSQNLVAPAPPFQLTLFFTQTKLFLTS